MPVQYYAASSLDGFIADDKDSVDFLDALEQPTVPTYERFIADVGALVMGRASYQFILNHMDQGHPWPYTQPTWVFTHQNLPAAPGVTFVSGAVTDAMPDLLAAANGKSIWVVGGGDLAGQFHDAGLLDEWIISVASTTLGSGKPVFPRHAKLELVSAEPMGSGFVELRYKPSVS